MRGLRFKVESAATYHLMSRAHESRFFFSDVEKGYMVHLMKRLCVFTGCELRTYAFLDNHFHILLHVPVRVELSDAEVKRRACVLYGKKKYSLFEQKWSKWEDKGQYYRVKEELDRFRVRMYDISEFMKTFKQRLSIYYNSNNGRTGAGTLWQSRFKSVLVEESEHAQLIVAAYIDLNPVRAGLVRDPKDYRWSGYAEAVARGGAAVKRLSMLFCNKSLGNRDVLELYRRSLYIKGGIRINGLTGEVFRPGFSRDVVERVLDEGGRISLSVLLYCRVRYFSDGVVMGSRRFVDEMLRDNKRHFTRLRCERGAKQMKNGEWGDLCSARELRSGIIFVPD